MMKKGLIAGLIALAIFSIVGTTAYAANNDQIPFRPFYWIAGKVNDVADAGDAGKAAGKQVVFYKDEASYDQGCASAIIDANGVFVLNAFDVYPIDLIVGNWYKVAIVNKDDYGMDPILVQITDAGFIVFPDGALVLKKGAGPKTGPKDGDGGGGDKKKVEEKPPVTKLWIGNRLYQPAIYKGDKKFIVSPNPEIRIQFSIDNVFVPSNDINDYSVVIDEGLPTAKTLTLTAQNVASKSFSPDDNPNAGKINGSEIKYTFVEPLASGSHAFTIKSKSSGAFGDKVQATYVATVEVLGGPLRLVGTPITYPSPFSISKQGTVSIQYELSANANIDLYLTGVSGERIKKYVINSGADGGSAGVNKVTWSGRTDQNYLAGNGIYVGTIIARDDNKLLGKFKLTIVD